MRHTAIFAVGTFSLALAQAPTPYAPPNLPGDGIGHHDFLFTSQLDDAVFLVRNGSVVWSDRVPGAHGHVQEAVIRPNGNFVLAYMGGVKEIAPDKQVVWNYSAPSKCEVHTAKPIGPDKILFVQNCEKARRTSCWPASRPAILTGYLSFRSARWTACICKHAVSP